jgi:hypothetical protein
MGDNDSEKSMEPNYYARQCELKTKFQQRRNQRTPDPGGGYIYPRNLDAKQQIIQLQRYPNLISYSLHSQAMAEEGGGVAPVLGGAEGREKAMMVVHSASDPEGSSRRRCGKELVRELGTAEEKKAIVVNMGKAKGVMKARFLAVGIFLLVLAVSSKVQTTGGVHEENMEDKRIPGRASIGGETLRARVHRGGRLHPCHPWWPPAVQG